MSYGGKSAGSGPALSTDLRNAAGGWGQIGAAQDQFQSGVANPPRPLGASLFSMPGISNTPGTPGYGAPATQSLATQMAQPIGLPNGQQLNMNPQPPLSQSLFGGMTPGDALGGGLTQIDPATGQPGGQQPTAQTGPQGVPPPTTGLPQGDTFGPRMGFGEDFNLPGQEQPVGTQPNPGLGNPPFYVAGGDQPIQGGPAVSQPVFAPAPVVQPAPLPLTQPAVRPGPLPTPARPSLVAPKPVSKPLSRPAPRAPMPTRATKGYISRLGK